MQFAATYKEKEELNQYWYSAKTIEYLAKEILRNNPSAVAFLSTPSLYYACEELQNDAASASTSKPTFVLFDYDVALPRVVHYDFNHPTTFPDEFAHKFDFIVIDPPFITEHVWTKYAESARFLVAPGGKLLLTTIAENKDMLATLLSCTLRRFQPSIPHLVYQYGTFANYDSPALDAVNPEIPQD
ncbi:hypothetical protein H310_10549 [Aphanomyces invadans]|uniref:Protein-lysine N-methyltransferase n=1 Tax=Aphanomyces invadans TaxID=157072 RepID=A0A024TS24_9STRA|nr:hypothetical protein H310_10549 [Aphanomyces invadans]ETV96396.1 hypothetical protein H310_10549 [Aphanomyces invadans]|eukprot:XP_008875188.1 hypothetical protein H310_10549 [Aphanomyces invadans]